MSLVQEGNWGGRGVAHARARRFFSAARSFGDTACCKICGMLTAGSGCDEGDAAAAAACCTADSLEVQLGEAGKHHGQKQQYGPDFNNVTKSRNVLCFRSCSIGLRP